MKKLLSVLCLLVGPVAFGQDALTIDGQTKVVEVDKIIVTKESKVLVTALPFTIKATPGAFDYRWSFPSGVSALDMGDSLKITAAPKGEVTVGVVVKTIDFKAEKVISKFQSLSFLVGEVPQPKPPTPEPDDPPPTPKPPIPVPVTSFRVVIIHESAKTLSAKEHSVIYGKKMRDWLTANTTAEGGWAGWRVFDKDQTADNDTPTIKALWAATAPKVTTVPAIAVEVNGAVEIIPLAATQDEMIAVLDRYRKGSK